LLAPYRKEAGLPEKAKCYPNWDGLDGHIAGHYLSALPVVGIIHSHLPTDNDQQYDHPRPSQLG